MPGASPWLTSEHETFRRALRTVVERELAPHADEWEEAGIFPREIYTLMGKLGYLGLRYAPDYGGAGLDFWYTLILAQELVQCGSVGTAVGLLAHMEFALSVIDARGTPEQKAEFLLVGGGVTWVAPLVPLGGLRVWLALASVAATLVGAVARAVRQPSAHAGGAPAR